MFVHCNEMETLVGEILVQVEEHRGDAIEGPSNEDQVKHCNLVDGKKQGEE